ncbi:MAG: type IV toxin-antitoxin system AbiEi family antitoxin [Bacteroidales bacterium]
METAKPTYNYISEYLTKVQSEGRYTISLEELRNKFNVSEKALLQNIYRLKSKKQLAQVRKEFYVIIPPQYLNRGMIPPTLFIDDMMQHLDKDYYVGLFSAAALHGASHQQPMEFQVITKKPALREIKNQKLSISFFIKKDWDREQITEKKSEAGYFNVSTPEMTAFDLVYYHKNIGGLNRIIPILEDLAEEIKPSLLTKTAKSQKSSTIQRLGYLLDGLGNNSLSNSLFKIIEEKKVKEIPLSLSHENRNGYIDKRWKLIINAKLDF